MRIWGSNARPRPNTSGTINYPPSDESVSKLESYAKHNQYRVSNHPQDKLPTRHSSFVMVDFSAQLGQRSFDTVSDEGGYRD